MSTRLTTKGFIERAIAIHGDKYDYSKTEYVNSRVKVKIKCHVHGEFNQVAGNHIRGQGCPKCAKYLTHEQYVEDVIKVHGDRYDYSHIEYITASSKITVGCPVHGRFDIRASNFKSGQGCPDCSRRDNTSQFVSNAASVHGDKYDYSKTEYVLGKEKLRIVCPTHGEFIQKANNHLNGKGCPKCFGMQSKPETEIANHIESLGLTVHRNVRGILDGQHEADLLIESNKVIIEYDGNIWHSEKFCRDKHNVLNKTKMVNEAGYRCIHIRDDQYLNNKQVVLSLIASALGVFDNRVGARKTVKRIITNKEYREFCETNHLQGWRQASNKYGLFYNDELVACIGYNNSDGELVRYVVKNGWSVSGALPKLIKNESIKYSYCDLSFFTGQSYLRAGFKFVRNTVPNYHYVKDVNVVTRLQRQKHKLPLIFDKCDMSKTEVEINAENGWYRIFDCGSALYTLDK